MVLATLLWLTQFAVQNITWYYLYLTLTHRM